MPRKRISYLNSHARGRESLASVGFIPSLLVAQTVYVFSEQIGRVCGFLWVMFSLPRPLISLTAYLTVQPRLPSTHSWWGFVYLCQESLEGPFAPASSSSFLAPLQVDIGKAEGSFVPSKNG